MKQNEDTVFKLLMAQILLVSMHKSLKNVQRKIKSFEMNMLNSDAIIQIYSLKMEAD